MSRDVKIHFVTNREQLARTGAPEDFGDEFNRARPFSFRLGVARLRLEGEDPQDAESWRFEGYELADENLSGPKETWVRGSDRILDEIRVELKETGADAMIHLHGFANSFFSALIAAAQMQMAYGTKKRRLKVVPFIWPSNGTTVVYRPYFDDRQDAQASGQAMGRALARFTDFMRDVARADREALVTASRAGGVPDPSLLKSCDRKVHLLAHSMGAWALRHALIAYQSERSGGMPRSIEECFLMCADEDRDALALPRPGWPQKLHRLTELCERVHVYHAANDKALFVSDATKGNPDRLGARGPEDLADVSQRVFAVDCEAVSYTGLKDSQHQYYRKRDEVIRDVKKTLDGKPLDGRKGREPRMAGRSWRLLPD